MSVGIICGLMAAIGCAIVAEEAEGTTWRWIAVLMSAIDRCSRR